MTLREQLDECLTARNKIFATTNTMIDPRIRKYIQEIQKLIPLIPVRFQQIKKNVVTDLEKLPNGTFINPFHYGMLLRDLDMLDMLLPKGSVHKIFISHSSKDEKIVHQFVNMLVMGTGIPKTEIFCTSIEGMRIENGEDLRKHIQTNIMNSDFAILLISDNYKKSEVCLNEMGAVWAFDKKIKTYIFPNMKLGSVEWIVDNIAIEKINDTTALASLYDSIMDFYGKPKFVQQWNAEVSHFCSFLSETFGTNNDNLPLKSDNGNKFGMSKHAAFIMQQFEPGMKNLTFIKDDHRLLTDGKEIQMPEGEENLNSVLDELEKAGIIKNTFTSQHIKSYAISTRRNSND